MADDKIQAFLAEYRDLVHRHGLAFTATRRGHLVVVEESEPDKHVKAISAATTRKPDSET